MREATPDEPLRHRTADITRGRVRLVEHSWPENVKTVAEHRHTAHICFLAHGAMEEKRGTSSLNRRPALAMTTECHRPSRRPFSKISGSSSWHHVLTARCARIRRIRSQGSSSRASRWKCSRRARDGNDGAPIAGHHES